MTELDFSKYNPVNQAANQAEDRAVSAAAASNTLGDKLRTAISERFQESPLAKQREGALKTFITSAPNARADIAEQVKGGTIFNPSQQQALIAGRRASDVVPLVSLNDLLQAQFGGMGDLVTAGTNAYKEQVGSLQGAAQLARQRADSALAQLYKTAEFNLEKAKVGAANAPSEIELLLAQLLGGQQGAAGETGVAGQGPTGPESFPTSIPSEDLQQRVTGTINSPGGQYTFNRLIQSWQPSGLPERQYAAGESAIDDETGTEIVFNGSEWVGRDQYKPGFLSSIFGR